MMSDWCNIFDAHTKILDSVSEATFESFRILQNKDQRRKSTSLHCGFSIFGEDKLKHRRNGKDFLAILWLFTYSSWVYHVSFYVSNKRFNKHPLWSRITAFYNSCCKDLLSLIFEI